MGSTTSESLSRNKNVFLADIVKEYLDFNTEIYLSTDASRTHIGAELFQLTNDGKHQTLGFISRI